MVADGNSDDVPGDADGDAIGCDGLLPFQPSNFTRCDLPAAGTAISVPSSSVAALDATAKTLQVDAAPVAISTVVVTQPSGPDLLVVVADSVSIAGQLRVTGSRPVAIVALSSFAVAGVINVGASATASGPGANVSACGSVPSGMTQVIGNGDSGGSGGGGGGFARAGAIGARVPTGGNDTNGGPMNGNTSLIPLRGGCRGGNGGFANGTGGGGGGAIQLVAGASLVIEGLVTSPGGGGTGTDVGGGGGGGGGSGGAILLEATDVTIGGVVTAQGGAGGEGSRRTTGFTGAGADGHTMDATAAVCTPVSSSGGKGGDGGAGGTVPGAGLQGTNDTTDAAGGGGGGGSVGRIHIGIDTTPTVSGLVSPTAT
jgi:hypothetical protein